MKPWNYALELEKLLVDNAVQGRIPCQIHRFPNSQSELPPCMKPTQQWCHSINAQSSFRSGRLTEDCGSESSSSPLQPRIKLWRCLEIQIPRFLLLIPAWARDCKVSQRLKVSVGRPVEWFMFCTSGTQGPKRSRLRDWRPCGQRREWPRTTHGPQYLTLSLLSYCSWYDKPKSHVRGSPEWALVGPLVFLVDWNFDCCHISGWNE